MQYEALCVTVVFCLVSTQEKKKPAACILLVLKISHSH